MSLVDQIKLGHSKVYRRAYIKRRLASDGSFETSWQEITNDVKRWGNYSVQLDAQSPNRFTFGNATLVMANDSGLYNPEDDETSLWYGYLSPQRTLIKIECGFIDQTLTSDGIYHNYETPNTTTWDEDEWDASGSEWDSSGIMFTGIISGDINLSNKNEVAFTVKPLMQLFQDYSAKNLTDWTSAGMTASQFVTMVRDHQDSGGNYIFRPFFENTTTNWDISTTSNVFANLNTSTAQDVIDSSVWEVVQKLAEAENFVPYVTRSGVFKFVSRAANSSSTTFEFHGGGSYSTTYGCTIKNIENFGKKLTKYYSRVQLKWVNAETSTSYEVYQSSMEVGPTNNPWNLGERTLSIENFFIPNSTVAQTIALNLFNEYSALKNEIIFTTSLIPHLEILDYVSMTYESPATSPYNLWDQANWAEDATSASNDLIFDLPTSDAIRLQDTRFKFLSIDVNLDKLETKFHAREV